MEDDGEDGHLEAEHDGGEIHGYTQVGEFVGWLGVGACEGKGKLRFPEVSLAAQRGVMRK